MEGMAEHLSTLVELGMGTSQAKVYLSLEKFDALSAQEISKESGITRPDVYRVLGELQESGFVERILAKPERFRSISVDTVVSSLMQKRIRKTAELHERAIRLTGAFMKSGVRKHSIEGFHFVLIPARAGVYVKAEKMLRDVQDCTCFLGLRRRMIAWLSSYLPLVEEALRRKVDCRMIMPEAKNMQIDKPFKLLRKYQNFTIRTILAEPKAGFSVWDNKEILLSTSTTDTPFPSPTLWSDNKATVDLCQDYFEHLWNDAKSVA